MMKYGIYRKHPYLNLHQNKNTICYVSDYEISDIIELWNRNKEIMSEDVLYRSADRENGFNKEIFLNALRLVQYKVINMGGNKLEKYGFTRIELKTDLAEHIDYEKHFD